MVLKHLGGVCKAFFPVFSGARAVGPVVETFNNSASPFFLRQAFSVVTFFVCFSPRAVVKGSLSLCCAVVALTRHSPPAYSSSSPSNMLIQLCCLPRTGLSFPSTVPLFNDRVPSIGP